MAKPARVRRALMMQAEATAQATRAVATAQATRAVTTAQATREAKAAHSQPAAWATGQLGPWGTRPLHDPCSDRHRQQQEQVLTMQVHEGAQGEHHVRYLHRG
jgi:hypothetical protein